MKQSAFVIVAVFLIVFPAWAAKQYVAVPDTSWDELSPYVEANIRVEFVEGELTVGASSHPYERQLFEPFDPILGEFSSVLLVEALGNTKTQKLLRETGEALKAQGMDPTALSRDELTALYWKELAGDELFMGRLEELFLKAQKKGQLKCIICGEGFDPQYLELM